jgi:hypothetical protein
MEKRELVDILDCWCIARQRQRRPWVSLACGKLGCGQRIEQVRDAGLGDLVHRGDRLIGPSAAEPADAPGSLVLEKFNYPCKRPGCPAHYSPTPLAMLEAYVRAVVSGRTRIVLGVDVG